MLTKTRLAFISLLALIATLLVVPTPAHATDFDLTTPPGAMAVSPNGEYVYFSRASFNPGTGVIKRLKVSDGTVTDIVTMNDPAGCHAHTTALAVTPDGSKLYAGGYSCVMTINLSDNSWTSSYTGNDWVQKIVVGTDAAYAAFPEGGAVFKATKSGGSWGSSWTQLVAPQGGGWRPVSRSAALAADGATVYVADENGDVRVINSSTGAESDLTGSGASVAIAIAPDGSYLLVLNGGRDLKRVELTGSNAGTVTSASFGSDWGLRRISIDSSGTYAYIGAVWSRALLKIRTSDLSQVDRVDFRVAYPALAADTPDDVVTSPVSGSNNVYVSSSALSKIISYPSAPYAPTSLTATPADDSATISFTAAQSGMSDVTNYEYRIDGTGSWTALSPADTTSPVTIPGLTNGTAAGIEIRAVNAVGTGPSSSSVTVTPQSTPRTPRSVSITPLSGQISISFTAPASDGGFAITNYEVSTDGGATWRAQSPAVTVGPIVVTGLTNGVGYSVSLRAVNALGGGTGSTPVTVTPNVASSGSSSSGTVRAPEPTPTASPSPSASPSPGTSSAPAVIAVPEPVAVGEGIVVVDGRVSKVAVNVVEGRKWQVKGEDFTLEFIPQALVGELEGSFTARAGTKVEVRGDGFAPGSLIASYLPGALADSLGQATVNSDTTFDVIASLPASLKAGQYVFQVNGLGTSTTVRSVNLGLQLLAAEIVKPKAFSQRVIFAKDSAVVGSKAKSALSAFVRKYPKATSALIVPVAPKGASGQELSLARKRATAAKSALRTQGFSDPIRIARKVRLASDATAGVRTMVWIKLAQ